MLKKEKVIEKLKTINDPELNISVWDLGLIYDIQISEDNELYIKMTLTTPGCPLMAFLPKKVEQDLKQLEGVKDVLVELVWDPPWRPEMLSDEAKKRLGIETE